MPTPQHKIDRLNETLHGENIEFLRDDLAFGVAMCIVEYDDPGLLKQFPDWVGQLVREMCDVYRQHGHYGIVSNLGDADHTDMVRKLTQLLAQEAP